MTRPGATWRNWARSAAIRPQRMEFPRTVGAVARAVTRAVTGNAAGQASTPDDSGGVAPVDSTAVEQELMPLLLELQRLRDVAADAAANASTATAMGTAAAPTPADGADETNSRSEQERDEHAHPEAPESHLF